MSTKIYTGFKFTTSSWDAVHRLVMDFRKELAASVFAERCRSIAVSACQILDRQALGLATDAEDSPFFSAYMEAMDWQSKNPATFDIALFPRKGTIYGMTFGESDPEERWFAKDFVVRWGYWNNTDRPDDVTDKEWKLRSRTWDAILEGYAPPAMSGFIAECIPKYPDMPTAEDLVPHLPPPKERAKRIAAETLFSSFVSPEDVKPIHRAGEFLRWATGEGAAEFHAEAERIEGLIDRDVTARMLEGGRLKGATT